MSQVTVKAQATHAAQTIIKFSTGAIEVHTEGKPVKNTKAALTIIAEAVKFEFDKTKINTRGLGSKLIALINPKPAKAPKAEAEAPKPKAAKAPKKAAKVLLGKDSEGKEVFKGDSIGWKDDTEICGIAVGKNSNEFKVEVYDSNTCETSTIFVEKSRTWSEEA